MNNIEILFKKSNYLLFEDQEDPNIAGVLATKQNFLKSMVYTEGTNTTFDRLISALEHSLESNNELMALSLISKINTTLVSMTESLDSILNVLNKK